MRFTGDDESVGVSDANQLNFMNTTPRISGDALRAIIHALKANASDLVPRLEILLKRDPIQEKTDSSPEMFAVDVDRQFATLVSDTLAVIPEDPTRPTRFLGQKASDLADQWRDCAGGL